MHTHRSVVGYVNMCACVCVSACVRACVTAISFPAIYYTCKCQCMCVLSWKEHCCIFALLNPFSVCDEIKHF